MNRSNISPLERAAFARGCLPPASVASFNRAAFAATLCDAYISNTSIEGGLLKPSLAATAAALTALASGLKHSVQLAADGAQETSAFGVSWPLQQPSAVPASGSQSQADMDALPTIAADEFEDVLKDLANHLWAGSFLDKWDHLQVPEYLASLMACIKGLRPPAAGAGIGAGKPGMQRSAARGDWMVLPTGWRSSSGGHAILAVIERTSEQSALVTLCNSGAGLGYHGASAERFPKVMARPSMTIRVPWENLTNEGIIFHWVALSCTQSQMNSAEKLYGVVLPALAGMPLQEAVALAPQMTDLVTPQRSGTCFHRALHSAMRYLMRARFGLSTLECKRVMLGLRAVYLTRALADVLRGGDIGKMDRERYDAWRAHATSTGVFDSDANRSSAQGAPKVLLDEHGYLIGLAPQLPNQTAMADAALLSALPEHAAVLTKESYVMDCDSATLRIAPESASGASDAQADDACAAPKPEGETGADDAKPASARAAAVRAASISTALPSEWDITEAVQVLRAVDQFMHEHDLLQQLGLGSLLSEGSSSTIDESAAQAAQDRLVEHMQAALTGMQCQPLVITASQARVLRMGCRTYARAVQKALQSSRITEADAAWSVGLTRALLGMLSNSKHVTLVGQSADVPPLLRLEDALVDVRDWHGFDMLADMRPVDEFAGDLKPQPPDPFVDLRTGEVQPWNADGTAPRGEWQTTLDRLARLEKQLHKLLQKSSSSSGAVVAGHVCAMIEYEFLRVLPAPQPWTHARAKAEPSAIADAWTPVVLPLDEQRQMLGQLTRLQTWYGAAKGVLVHTAVSHSLNMLTTVAIACAIDHVARLIPNDASARARGVAGMSPIPRMLNGLGLAELLAQVEKDVRASKDQDKSKRGEDTGGAAAAYGAKPGAAAKNEADAAAAAAADPDFQRSSWDSVLHTEPPMFRLTITSVAGYDMQGITDTALTADPWAAMSRAGLIKYCRGMAELPDTRVIFNFNAMMAEASDGATMVFTRALCVLLDRMKYSPASVNRGPTTEFGRICLWFTSGFGSAAPDFEWLRDSAFRIKAMLHANPSAQPWQSTCSPGYMELTWSDYVQVMPLGDGREAGIFQVHYALGSNLPQPAAPHTLALSTPLALVDGAKDWLDDKAEAVRQSLEPDNIQQSFGMYGASPEKTEEAINAASKRAPGTAAHRLVSEADIVALKNMPLGETLSAQAAEALLSMLTAPYIRLPMVLSWIAKNRVGSLFSPVMRLIVERLLFEPLAWAPAPQDGADAREQDTHAALRTTPIVTVPLREDVDGNPVLSSVSQVDSQHASASPQVADANVTAADVHSVFGTPGGILINELLHNPSGVLQPLCSMLDTVATHCTGRFTSSFVDLLLFCVRCVVRVEGFLAWLVAHPRTCNMSAGRHAELSRCLAELRALTLGNVRATLTRYIAQATEAAAEAARRANAESEGQRNEFGGRGGRRLNKRARAIIAAQAEDDAGTGSATEDLEQARKSCAVLHAHRALLYQYLGQESYRAAHQGAASWKFSQVCEFFTSTAAVLAWATQVGEGLRGMQTHYSLQDSGAALMSFIRAEGAEPLLPMRELLTAMQCQRDRLLRIVAAERASMKRLLQRADAEDAQVPALHALLNQVVAQVSGNPDITQAVWQPVVRNDQRCRAEIASAHPMTTSGRYRWQVHFPGSKRLQVSFDRRTRLNDGTVKLYSDAECKQRIGRAMYTDNYGSNVDSLPGVGLTPPVVVPGDTLVVVLELSAEDLRSERFLSKSKQHRQACWGLQLAVEADVAVETAQALAALPLPATPVTQPLIDAATEDEPATWPLSACYTALALENNVQDAALARLERAARGEEAGIELGSSESEAGNALGLFTADDVEVNLQTLDVYQSGRQLLPVPNEVAGSSMFVDVFGYSTPLCGVEETRVARTVYSISSGAHRYKIDHWRPLYAPPAATRRDGVDLLPAISVAGMPEEEYTAEQRRTRRRMIRSIKALVRQHRWREQHEATYAKMKAGEITLDEDDEGEVGSSSDSDTGSADEGPGGLVDLAESQQDAIQALSKNRLEITDERVCLNAPRRVDGVWTFSGERFPSTYQFGSAGWVSDVLERCEDLPDSMKGTKALRQMELRVPDDFAELVCQHDTVLQGARAEVLEEQRAKDAAALKVAGWGVRASVLRTGPDGYLPSCEEQTHNNSAPDADALAAFKLKALRKGGGLLAADASPVLTRMLLIRSSNTDNAYDSAYEAAFNDDGNMDDASRGPPPTVYVLEVMRFHRRVRIHQLIHHARRVLPVTVFSTDTRGDLVEWISGAFGGREFSWLPDMRWAGAMGQSLYLDGPSISRTFVGGESVRNAAPEEQAAERAEQQALAAGKDDLSGQAEAAGQKVLTYLRAVCPHRASEQFVHERFLEGLIPASLASGRVWWRRQEHMPDGSTLTFIRGYPADVVKAVDDDADIVEVAIRTHRYADAPERAALATIRRAKLRVTASSVQLLGFETLVNTLDVVPGSELERIVSVLRRVDNMAGVLLWTRAGCAQPEHPQELTAGLTFPRARSLHGERVPLHTVELPDLETAFTIRRQPGKPAMLVSADFAGLSLSDARPKALDQLAAGLPYSLVLEDERHTLSLLVPNYPCMPVTISRDAPLSTESKPLKNTFWSSSMPAKLYLYPVHASGTFLAPPSLAAALLLATLRLMNRNYSDAARLLRTCFKDSAYTGEEDFLYGGILRSQRDAHPDAHAVRLLAALVGASTGMFDSLKSVHHRGDNFVARGAFNFGSASSGGANSWINIIKGDIQSYLNKEAHVSAAAGLSVQELLDCVNLLPQPPSAVAKYFAAALHAQRCGLQVSDSAGSSAMAPPPAAVPALHKEPSRVDGATKRGVVVRQSTRIVTSEMFPAIAPGSSARLPAPGKYKRVTDWPGTERMELTFDNNSILPPGATLEFFKDEECTMPIGPKLRGAAVVGRLHEARSSNMAPSDKAKAIKQIASLRYNGSTYTPTGAAVQWIPSWPGCEVAQEPLVLRTDMLVTVLTIPEAEPTKTGSTGAYASAAPAEQDQPEQQDIPSKQAPAGEDGEASDEEESTDEDRGMVAAFSVTGYVPVKYESWGDKHDKAMADWRSLAEQQCQTMHSKPQAVRLPSGDLREIVDADKAREATAWMVSELPEHGTPAVYLEQSTASVPAAEETYFNTLHRAVCERTVNATDSFKAVLTHQQYRFGMYPAPAVDWTSVYQQQEGAMSYSGGDQLPWFLYCYTKLVGQEQVDLCAASEDADKAALKQVDAKKSSAAAGKPKQPGADADADVGAGHGAGMPGSQAFIMSQVSAAMADVGLSPVPDGDEAGFDMEADIEGEDDEDLGEDGDNYDGINDSGAPLSAALFGANPFGAGAMEGKPFGFAAAAAAPEGPDEAGDADDDAGSVDEKDEQKEIEAAIIASRDQFGKPTKSNIMLIRLLLQTMLSQVQDSSMHHHGGGNNRDAVLGMQTLLLVSIAAEHDLQFGHVMRLLPLLPQVPLYLAEAEDYLMQHSGLQRVHTQEQREEAKRIRAEAKKIRERCSQMFRGPGTVCKAGLWEYARLPPQANQPMRMRRQTSVSKRMDDMVQIAFEKQLFNALAIITSTPYFRLKYAMEPTPLPGFLPLRNAVAVRLREEHIRPSKALGVTNYAASSRTLAAGADAGAALASLPQDALPLLSLTDVELQELVDQPMRRLVADASKRIGRPVVLESSAPGAAESSGLLAELPFSVPDVPATRSAAGTAFLDRLQRDLTDTAKQQSGPAACLEALNVHTVEQLRRALFGNEHAGEGGSAGADATAAAEHVPTINDELSAELARAMEMLGALHDELVRANFQEQTNTVRGMDALYSAVNQPPMHASAKDALLMQLQATGGQQALLTPEVLFGATLSTAAFNDLQHGAGIATEAAANAALQCATVVMLRTCRACVIADAAAKVEALQAQLTTVLRSVLASLWQNAHAAGAVPLVLPGTGLRVLQHEHFNVTRALARLHQVADALAAAMEAAQQQLGPGASHQAQLELVSLAVHMAGFYRTFDAGALLAAVQAPATMEALPMAKLGAAVGEGVPELHGDCSKALVPANASTLAAALHAVHHAADDVAVALGRQRAYTEEKLATEREFDPRFLAFEFVLGIMLRKRQVTLVRDFMAAARSGQSSVHQLLMGAGKTTVVGPLLALMLADGQSLVTQVVPAPLVSQTCDVLRLRFGSVLFKRVSTLNFERASREYNNKFRLELLFDRLDRARKEGAIVVAAPESIKSIMLKYLDLLQAVQNAPAELGPGKSSDVLSRKASVRLLEKAQLLRANSEQADVLRDILRLFGKDCGGILLLDEVDQVLHSLRSELNFPIGSRSQLDMSPSRWLFALHLLDAVLAACPGGRGLTPGASGVVIDMNAEVADVLDSMRAIVRDGVADYALQLSPHLVMLREDWYHSALKPVVARWAVIWMRHVRSVRADFGVLADTSAVKAADSDADSDEETPMLGMAELYVQEGGSLGEDVEAAIATYITTTGWPELSGALSMASKATVKCLNLARDWMMSLLPFVLSKINRVHYGTLTALDTTNLRQRGAPAPTGTRQVLAVPFVGRDTPSPSSEFAHADVLIGLTFLAMRYQGLRTKDVNQLVSTLKEDMAVQNGPYDDREAHRVFAGWLRASTASGAEASEQLAAAGLGDDAKASAHAAVRAAEAASEVLPLHLVQPIDPKQRRQLTRALSRVPDATAHFLRMIVFPDMLRHQSQKLMASGVDLGSDMLFPVRLGFSGTPSDLLPTGMGKCHHEVGSDAAMVRVLVDPRVVSIQHLEGHWDVRSLLNQVATAQNPPFGALIDTGALITGMSNRETAQYLLDHGIAHVKGCVFLENDEKMVLLRAGGAPVPLAQCGLRPSEYFTYFSQVHTTGIDIAQALDARAAVTIGKDMTLRDYAQGAWRMRGLGRGQTLTAMVVPEVRKLIETRTGRDAGQPDRARILSFLVQNSCASEALQSVALVEQNLAYVWRRVALQDLMQSNAVSVENSGAVGDAELARLLARRGMARSFAQYQRKLMRNTKSFFDALADNVQSDESSDSEAGHSDDEQEGGKEAPWAAFLRFARHMEEQIAERLSSHTAILQSRFNVDSKLDAAGSAAEVPPPPAPLGGPAPGLNLRRAASAMPGPSSAPLTAAAGGLARHASVPAAGASDAPGGLAGMCPGSLAPAWMVACMRIFKDPLQQHISDQPPSRRPFVDLLRDAAGRRHLFIKNVEGAEAQVDRIIASAQVQRVSDTQDAALAKGADAETEEDINATLALRRMFDAEIVQEQEAEQEAEAEREKAKEREKQVSKFEGTVRPHEATWRVLDLLVPPARLEEVHRANTFHALAAWRAPPIASSTAADGPAVDGAAAGSSLLPAATPGKQSRSGQSLDPLALPAGLLASDNHTGAVRLDDSRLKGCYVAMQWRLPADVPAKEALQALEAAALARGISLNRVSDNVTWAEDEDGSGVKQQKPARAASAATTADAAAEDVVPSEAPGARDTLHTGTVDAGPEFTVVITLAEAETLRRALHVGNPCVGKWGSSAAKAQVRLYALGGDALDSEAGESEAESKVADPVSYASEHPPAMAAQLAALQFFDCDLFFNQRAAAALLIALQQVPVKARREFLAACVANRRRERMNLQETPLWALLMQQEHNEPLERLALLAGCSSAALAQFGGWDSLWAQLAAEGERAVSMLHVAQTLAEASGARSEQFTGAVRAIAGATGVELPVALPNAAQVYEALRASITGSQADQTTMERLDLDQALCGSALFARVKHAAQLSAWKQAADSQLATAQRSMQHELQQFAQYLAGLAGPGASLADMVRLTVMDDQELVGEIDAVLASTLNKSQRKAVQLSRDAPSLRSVSQLTHTLHVAAVAEQCGLPTVLSGPAARASGRTGGWVSVDMKPDGKEEDADAKADARDELPDGVADLPATVAPSASLLRAGCWYYEAVVLRAGDQVALSSDLAAAYRSDRDVYALRNQLTAADNEEQQEEEDTRTADRPTAVHERAQQFKGCVVQADDAVIGWGSVQQDGSTALLAGLHMDQSVQVQGQQAVEPAGMLSAGDVVGCVVQVESSAESSEVRATAHWFVNGARRGLAEGVQLPAALMGVVPLQRLHGRVDLDVNYGNAAFALSTQFAQAQAAGLDNLDALRAAAADSVSLPSVDFLVKPEAAVRTADGAADAFATPTLLPLGALPVSRLVQWRSELLEIAAAGDSAGQLITLTDSSVQDNYAIVSSADDYERLCKLAGAALSSGRWYFEWTFSRGSEGVVGFHGVPWKFDALHGASLYDSASYGVEGHGPSLIGHHGLLFRKRTGASHGERWKPKSAHGIALDLDRGRMWYSQLPHEDTGPAKPWQGAYGLAFKDVFDPHGLTLGALVYRDVHLQINVGQLPFTSKPPSAAKFKPLLAWFLPRMSAISAAEAEATAALGETHE